MFQKMKEELGAENIRNFSLFIKHTIMTSTALQKQG